MSSWNFVGELVRDEQQFGAGISGRIALRVV